MLASAHQNGRDRFDEAFLAGVVDPLDDPDGAAARQELVARAAPADAIALHGCVLTPARVIEKGHVIVADGTIAAVQEAKPQGVRVFETDGVILPGLIDLHGHPEFNVFAAWEPPRLFDNRYAWRGSDLYQRLVRDPQNQLLDKLPAQTQLRYAEIRALVGGVTAIQGASGRSPGTEESLVRNVDLQIFGEHRARGMIDLPSDSSRDMVRLKRILGQIEAGDVTAFYLHLAEGRSANERSRREFDRLVELHGVTPATVVIHGTALDRDQLGDLKDAGAKLVWSPQSNLRLYGETTRAAEALALGLPVGLGADWLPSGSTSLLAELKVARRGLANQGLEAKPADLVEMVTSTAASIAGLGHRLGSLEEGRAADVVVLQRSHEDPHLSVVEAEPAAVALVMINGDVAYGRADWVSDLVAPADVEQFERLIAWGNPMALDTSYRARPGSEPAPRLDALREQLIAQYPQVGPIFA